MTQPSGDPDVLHDLFDAMPQLGWTAHPDGTVDRFNRGWYEYTGGPNQQTRDGGWAVVLHPDEASRVREGWAAAVAAGEQWKLEFRIRRHDGVYRWFVSRASPIRDAQGLVRKWVGISTDIDDQKRAQLEAAAARREAERLQTMLSTAQSVARIGVFEWDITAERLYWSPELFTLMGLTPGEIEPTTEEWTKRVHPDDAPAGWKKFAEASAARQTMHETEQRILMPSGGSRWMRISNHIVYSESGEPACVTGTMIDIEDLRDLAARERAARLEAEEANHAKDDFLAMLGHELRSPLAPILTAAHVMRHRGDARVAREVDVIERQANHLVRLVDDLLDVSRVARGKVGLARERVEISDVVAAAIETASTLIETGSHELRVDVPKDGLKVEVDHFRMCQVLANLLTNAAKYTPAGGTITVRARRRSDAIEVTIADTGTGIAAELLPHVFDLFVQSRQTISRSQGGLGLGLSIVKSLVTLHGGTVEASSDGVGRGSAFTVVLPEAPEHTTAAPVAAPPPPALETKRRRVLIVDDNEDAAEMLGAALKLAGFETAIAFDGLEALRVANEFYPHVALLDIGLPVMDGYELAGKLRLDHGASLVLVAITGYGQESDRVRSREAGFREHLTKPVHPKTLVELLRRR